MFVTGQIDGTGTGSGMAGAGPRGIVGMVGGATGPAVKLSWWPPKQRGAKHSPVLRAAARVGDV
jgi:hypothetical protein